jgi:hypothetical protein
MRANNTASFYFLLTCTSVAGMQFSVKPSSQGHWQWFYWWPHYLAGKWPYPAGLLPFPTAIVHTLPRRQCTALHCTICSTIQLSALATYDKHSVLDPMQDLLSPASPGSTTEECTLEVQHCTHLYSATMYRSVLDSCALLYCTEIY